ncbi:hypothetical protein U0070_010828 [Myodes glareolus]|uniref:PEST proteolytic signal-containing nuclear protein n=1 Tax=Myodes glareolus TaxID=447135 RepID=A0AAW0I3P8_MYOGA
MRGAKIMGSWGGKVGQRLKTPDLPKRKTFEENPASKFSSASKNASPVVDGEDRMEEGNHTA